MGGVACSSSDPDGDSNSAQAGGGSGSGDTEIIENIKENSVGYVKQLEMLTNFSAKQDGWQVFMYFKKLDIDKEETK